MTNHPAALRALASAISQDRVVREEYIIEQLEAIASDLEKAQGEPVGYIHKTDEQKGLISVLEWHHLSENAPRVSEQYSPLFAARPPAIPTEAPESFRAWWLGYYERDRYSAQATWAAVRECLAATAPKVDVPKNWVLVPKMLTTPMANAIRAAVENRFFESWPANCWEDAIEAAPKESAK